MKAFSELDNREQCATNDFCTQPANMSGECHSSVEPNTLAKISFRIVGIVGIEINGRENEKRSDSMAGCTVAYFIVLAECIVQNSG